MQVLRHQQFKSDQFDSFQLLPAPVRPQQWQARTGIVNGCVGHDAARSIDEQVENRQWREENPVAGDCLVCGLFHLSIQKELGQNAR